MSKLLGHGDSGPLIQPACCFLGAKGLQFRPEFVGCELVPPQPPVVGPVPGNIAVGGQRHAMGSRRLTPVFCVDYQGTSVTAAAMGRVYGDLLQVRRIVDPADTEVADGIIMIASGHPDPIAQMVLKQLLKSRRGIFCDGVHVEVEKQPTRSNFNFLDQRQFIVCRASDHVSMMWDPSHQHRSDNATSGR